MEIHFFTSATEDANQFDPFTLGLDRQKARLDPTVPCTVPVGYDLQQSVPVLVIDEDRLAPVAASGDVIDGA